ncbi:hypothetical protein HD554DRAFT_2043229 [Boletus coccyginus]|nr:hypothetical protein HD554DRAFT_2043229 [Boletus coccyginus]
MSSSFDIAEFASLQKDITGYIVREGNSLSQDVKNYLQLVSDALSYTSEMTKEGDRIDFVWPVAPRGSEATLELVQEWKERRVQEKGEHSIGSANKSTSGRSTSTRSTSGQNASGQNKSGRDTSGQNTSGQSLSVQGNQSISGQGTNAQVSAQSNKRPAQQAAEDGPTRKRARSLSHPIVDFHFTYLLELIKDKPELACSVLNLQHALRLVNAGANPKLAEWHVKRIQNPPPSYFRNFRGRLALESRSIAVRNESLGPTARCWERTSDALQIYVLWLSFSGTDGGDAFLEGYSSGQEVRQHHVRPATAVALDLCLYSRSK